jgi:hypothetical protein
LFGLTNSEGSHGEDVKEYYFYLESTPTHSYMKYLYKYPQEAYPYDDLVKTNAKRTRLEAEYELIDTKVFDENRYFDVFVEYCKEGPEDLLIQITAANRAEEAAILHLLPHLWFRNTWTDLRGTKAATVPQLRAMDGAQVAHVPLRPSGECTCPRFKGNADARRDGSTAWHQPQAGRSMARCRSSARTFMHREGRGSLRGPWARSSKESQRREIIQTATVRTLCSQRKSVSWQCGRCGNG